MGFHQSLDWATFNEKKQRALFGFCTVMKNSVSKVAIGTELFNIPSRDKLSKNSESVIYIKDLHHPVQNAGMQIPLMIIQNSHFGNKKLSQLLYGTEACTPNAAAGPAEGYQWGM